jgi:pimeloyl-[acyl-carrier protein] methyl ester esterase
MGPGVFDELRAQLAMHREVHALALAGYAGTAACEPYTLERLAQSAAAAAPARCHVVGWSLGAQVALEWARRAPQQVADLVLLGATPCFVRQGDWQCAMEPEVFHEFAAGVRDEPDGTLKRFASLQAFGDGDVKRVTRYLRAHLQSDVACTTLMGGLDVLSETDLRGVLCAIDQRALIVHGERDTLVPEAAGEYLARALPHGHFRAITGAAHAAFVSKEMEVRDATLEFFDD